jgi:hypothetical protein
MVGVIAIGVLPTSRRAGGQVAAASADAPAPGRGMKKAAWA